MKSHNAVITVFVLVLITIGHFSVSLYTPSLISIGEELNIHSEWIQMTLTVYLIGFGLSQLIYGSLMDSFGRKDILLIGLAIFVFGGLICTLTSTLKYLLAGRLIQGLGIGASSVGARVILSDTFSGRKLLQLSAYCISTFAFMIIIAPVIGGYVENHFGWRSNFGIMVIFGGLLLFAIVAALPETGKEHQPFTLLHAFKKYGQLLKNTPFISYAAIHGLIYGGMCASALITPYILIEQLQFNSVEFGWMTLLIAMGYLLGGLSNSILVKEFPIKRLMYLGLTLTMMSSMSLIFYGIVDHITHLVVVSSMFTYTLGAGLINPIAMGLALESTTQHRGSAGALLGTIIMIGGSLVSWIVSKTEETDLLTLGLIIGGIASTTTLTYLILNIKLKTTKEIQDLS